MSNDLINQITLNYLISKQQLEKLNKCKENPANKQKQKREIYKQRVLELFTNMLDGNHPNGLLMEVKKSFDYYIDNCIYYFEVHDNHIEIEEKRVGVINDVQEEDHNEEYLEEDCDEDSDENCNEDCNEECAEQLDGLQNDTNYQEGSDIELSNNQEIEIKTLKTPTNMHLTSQENHVYPKKKNAISQGVENINQLPLDWFTKVKKQNDLKKQNHIKIIK
jgi:hypothetical protein